MFMYSLHSSESENFAGSQYQCKSITEGGGGGVVIIIKSCLLAIEGSHPHSGLDCHCRHYVSEVMVLAAVLVLDNPQPQASLYLFSVRNQLTTKFVDEQILGTKQWLSQFIIFSFNSYTLFYLAIQCVYRTQWYTRLLGTLCLTLDCTVHRRRKLMNFGGAMTVL